MPTLMMTDGELLRMENLTLKLTVIQSNAEKQAAPIVAARNDLGREIGQRLGIEISEYNINLDTGAIVAKPKGPAVLPVTDPDGPSDEPGEATEQAAG